MKTHKLFNDIKTTVALKAIDGTDTRFSYQNYLPYCLFGLLLICWPLLQRLVTGSDETVGFVDPNIWLLILLSQICFFVTMGLSWWLLQRFWVSIGLPGLGSMVLQFESLPSWEQLKFALCLYALLLLAGVGCMLAVL